MQSHNLIQGTPEWLAYRRDHFNASDAPAMMGVSPYKTRAALLRELSTGIAPEVTDQQQYLFGRGHKFEGASRGEAETTLGEELFPIVANLGKLSASFDGLTMDERIVWEHKTLNNEIRSCFRSMETIAPAHREQSAGRELPLQHRIQMEQQLHVSGAEKVLFTASRWSDDGVLEEAVHCWYFPDAKLRAEILAGWEQFERDLAAYAPPAAAPAVAEGRAPEVLPALRIEVRGEVTASNLAEFKTTALRAIRSVRRDLATDQDFADAEASVKWCADVESRLEGAKQHALSQTASIDALFRTIDEISAEARRVRLEVEKLVKTRKESIREEIVVGARRALQDHVAALASECAPAVLSLSGVGDFAGAIKGKRTVQTLREACDAELARARIALDNQARQIRGNLAGYDKVIGQNAFLFPDLSTLLHKAADDFDATVSQRIAAHMVKEAQRVQAERDRIRAEEEARAEQRAAAARAEEQRQAEAKARADQAEAERRARAIAAATPSTADIQRSAGNVIGQAARAADAGAIEPDRAERIAGLAAGIAAGATIEHAKANEPPTLKLGTICERLAPVQITAAGLEALGIRHAATAGAARLYRESDFPRICAAISDCAERAAARDWRVAA